MKCTPLGAEEDPREKRSSNAWDHVVAIGELISKVGQAAIRGPSSTKRLDNCTFSRGSAGYPTRATMPVHGKPASFPFHLPYRLQAGHIHFNALFMPDRSTGPLQRHRTPSNHHQ